MKSERIRWIKRSWYGETGITEISAAAGVDDSYSKPPLSPLFRAERMDSFNIPVYYLQGSSSIQEKVTLALTKA
jgi:hypothetical protein